MDSPTIKQAGFSARNSSVDVSQLDKINAIPNRTADNVLLSDLCPEDQHYLKVLMDNDSSESDEESDLARRRSSAGAWSPLVQSPMIANKRIKKLRPSYAITLSLEDISYIRPSWGISKARTIEVDGKKKKKKIVDECERAKTAKKRSSEKTTEVNYKYFLVILTIVVVFLTVPPYMSEQKKFNDNLMRNKIRLNIKTKSIEIYRPDRAGGSLESLLRVQFGQGVPANLKPEECTCGVFWDELNKLVGRTGQLQDEPGGVCFACLDWAIRANMRLLVEHKNDADICYNVKWQSYDGLATPLIDCFVMEDNDQWFGLGDIQSPEWLLNRMDFEWTSLRTNLSAESVTAADLSGSKPQLSLGSYTNFTLFSTSGIFIGDLESDFEISARIGVGRETSKKELCIKASCTDKCGRVWSRVSDEHLAKFRHSNNVLEYRICSSSSSKSLISNYVTRKVQSLDEKVRSKQAHWMNGEISTAAADELRHDGGPQFERMLEKESSPGKGSDEQHKSLDLNETAAAAAAAAAPGNIWPPPPPSSSAQLPEGIGLIERTIFATSAEFMPVLDGQTLRQYVDSVVKMGLRTSLILLIDSRWETYIGSLQLNTALFPKSRLLFEILHNKGFKIILTLKPYVDTFIGVGAINELFESGKLYGISHALNHQVDQAGFAPRRSQLTTILRRRSLFSIANETIEMETQNGSATTAIDRPYVFQCRESQVGYCALLDLTRPSTRSWLADSVRGSDLLTVDAQATLISGAHPNSFAWDDHYRRGIGDLVTSLYFRERIFALPQWTGDLGYIQLAPRPFTWDGLKSVVNSVLNLGLEGFSLIHPGSVWGDLKVAGLEGAGTTATNNRTGGGGFHHKQPPLAARKMVDTSSIYDEDATHTSSERSNKELAIRWLQVGIFLPILQFNNIAPIERFGLHDLLQNLVKIRKLYIIAELKKNLPYTPLISQSKFNSTTTGLLPAIRPIWFNQQHLAIEAPETIILDQFALGPDILVAPILSDGQRQRDIYLPNGFWHDELRQMNLRGGKWLRNYPVELTEIAWFTRAKR